MQFVSDTAPLTPHSHHPHKPRINPWSTSVQKLIVVPGRIGHVG